MISELGFLSPEIEESETAIATTYCDFFDLSERISRLFVQLLQETNIDHTSQKSTAINALAAKSLELFQSSVIMLRKGCIPAARILCRALIDTVYKLCAITLASDGIDRYISQEKRTRLQKLKCIQKYKQKYPKSGIAPCIEAEIDKLSRENSVETKPHEWASLAQMNDFHNLYYQGMSDDTHGNIESLNHYFDEESAHIISFGPSDKGLAITAAACIRSLINAIEKYASFQHIDISNNLALFSKENDELEHKYCGG